MASTVAELVCVHCGKSYRPTGREMTCGACGPDDGILEFRFDLEAVRAAWEREPLLDRPRNHWRFRELLPLDPAAIPQDCPVGWTPIVELSRLAKELGVKHVLVKDEGRNPTASLKDRASSVGVAHARQNHATTIACASTGNAATSLAGHAALFGMPCVIFVPRNAAAPKLAQMLVYGACVFSVAGPYDDAYRLCSAACDRFGWYNRNCAINPVLVEGKKTCGLEIAEQAAAVGCVPDWVVVSVGDGCTIAGIGKGLAEMHALGVIDRLPRLLGVQAAGVAPIDHAWRHDALPPPNAGTTIADGINVPVPRNWRKAVSTVRAADGAMVTVTDEQILAALAQAGRHGVFGEPAAAASIAGVKVAVEQGIIKTNERVLTVNTGSGLKDTASAMKAVGEPHQIEADLDAVAAGVEAFEREGVHGS
jgi:threonine synthase